MTETLTSGETPVILGEWRVAGRPEGSLRFFVVVIAEPRHLREEGLRHDGLSLSNLCPCILVLKAERKESPRRAISHRSGRRVEGGALLFGPEPVGPRLVEGALSFPLDIGA